MNSEQNAAACPPTAAAASVRIVSERTAYLAARTRLVRRLKAAGVLACCLTALGIAAYLRPNESGTGTHTELGFRPCGFLVMTGRPCPTCGMTTAFSHVMHGHPWRGFVVQPGGAVLCAGTILAAALSLTVLVTGRGIYIPWYRLDPKWIVIACLVVFLGSWGYKMIAMSSDK